MAYKEGVIEQINIKDRKTGQYGDFAGFSIKIDGVWYSAGLANADKATGALVPRDKDKKPLANGTKVDFKYTTNDKGYHEVEKGTLAVVGAAVQPPPGQQAPQQPVQQPSKQPSYAAASIWLTAAQVAAQMATGMKFEVEGEPVKFATDKVIQMADVLFKEANLK